MQSFKSRELVTELFAWRHYYWFLTDEGIEYLRVYLNLPSEIVPATLKKSTRPLEKDGGRPPRRDYGDRPPRREGGFGGDRRYCLTWLWFLNNMLPLQCCGDFQVGPFASAHTAKHLSLLMSVMQGLTWLASLLWFVANCNA